jgi:hypothetical protein
MSSVPVTCRYNFITKQMTTAFSDASITVFIYMWVVSEYDRIRNYFVRCRFCLFMLVHYLTEEGLPVGAGSSIRFKHGYAVI